MAEHTIYLPSIVGHADDSVAADARPYLGAGFPRQVLPDPSAALVALQPAWWYDWHYDQIGRAGYLPMMYSRLSPTMESYMLRHPGSLWLGPNEPELGEQANMTPDDCANAVQAAMALGVRVSLPAVRLTPTGYWSADWLDRYLTIWNGRHAGNPDREHAMLAVHIYAVADVAAWLDLFATWRGLLHGWGLSGATLVTETNADHGDEAAQAALLRGLLAAWPAGLVGIGWFSAQWRQHTEANLWRGDRLTALGSIFAEAT